MSDSALNQFLGRCTLWSPQSKKFNVLIQAVLYSLIFQDGLFYSLQLPLLPVYQEVLHVSDSAIGFLFSIYPLSVMIFSLFWIVYSHKFTFKIPVLVALCLYLVANFLWGFIHNYYVLIVARAVHGIASSVLWSTVLKFIGAVFLEEQQGTLTGRVMSVLGGGLLIGPAVGGVSYQLVGHLFGPFIVPSVLSILLMGPLITFDERGIRWTGKTTGEEDNNDSLLHEVQPEDIAELEFETKATLENFSIWPVLLDFNLMAVVSISGVANVGSAGIDTILPLFLDDRYSLSPFWIGLILAAETFWFAVGSTMFGWLSDRFYSLRSWFIVGSLLATLVFYFILGFSFRLSWFDTESVALAGLVLFLSLLGLSLSGLEGFSIPLSTAIAGRRYGKESHGAVAGLINIWYSVGALAGSLGMSITYDLWGWTASVAGLGCSVIAVWLVIIAWVLFKERHNLLPEETDKKIPTQDEIIFGTALDDSEIHEI